MVLNIWILLLSSLTFVICDVTNEQPNNNIVAASRSQQLLPFGNEYGDVRLPSGDDESSEEITLRTPIVYFDTVFESIYVSTYTLFETYISDIPISLYNQACSPEMDLFDLTTYLQLFSMTSPSLFLPVSKRNFCPPPLK